MKRPSSRQIFFALAAAAALGAAVAYWRLPRDNRVRVRVSASLPPGAPLEVEVRPREIAFKPGEPFSATLVVKNRSDKEVWAKVAHNVEPEIMAKYMGMLDCGSFLPFHLGPKAEAENTSTYLIWTDIPKDLKRFTLNYQFEVDRD
jgi:cytochrome c oxidase assembly protein Cox11